MTATIPFEPVDLEAAESELAELEQRPLPDRAALEAWIDDWARIHDRLDEGVCWKTRSFEGLKL